MLVDEAVVVVEEDGVTWRRFMPKNVCVGGRKGGVRRVWEG